MLDTMLIAGVVMTIWGAILTGYVHDTPRRLARVGLHVTRALCVIFLLFPALTVWIGRGTADVQEAFNRMAAIAFIVVMWRVVVAVGDRVGGWIRKREVERRPA